MRQGAASLPSEPSLMGHNRKRRHDEFDKQTHHEPSGEGSSVLCLPNKRARHTDFTHKSSGFSTQTTFFETPSSPPPQDEASPLILEPQDPASSMNYGSDYDFTSEDEEEAETRRRRRTGSVCTTEPPLHIALTQARRTGHLKSGP